MIRTMLLAFSTSLLLGACASAPEAPAPVPPMAAAPAVQPTVEGEPAAKAAGEIVKPSEYQPPPGFTQKLRRGQTVYCRSRASLGTRVKTEECYTQAEIAEVENAMRTRRQDIEQKGRMCPSGQMCTGG
jgi:Tfp pilus assembly protein FimV